MATTTYEGHQNVAQGPRLETEAGDTGRLLKASPFHTEQVIKSTYLDNAAFQEEHQKDLRERTRKKAKSQAAILLSKDCMLCPKMKMHETTWGDVNSDSRTLRVKLTCNGECPQRFECQDLKLSGEFFEEQELIDAVRFEEKQAYEQNLQARKDELGMDFS